MRRPAAALLFALALGPVACGSAPQPKPAAPVASAAPPPSALPPDPEPFRASRPPAGEASRFSYPIPEPTRLANGLNVYFVPRPSRVVALRLVVRHGAGSVPEGQSGLAGLTARMLTESTRKKSSAALAEAVESLGTTLNSDADFDSSEASLTVLPGDVPRALALISEVVTSPAFVEDDFARVKNEWLDALRAERQTPRRMATIVAMRALLGPRFGAPVNGSVPDVEKLTTRELRDFHKKAYTPDNAALIVVGNVDKAKLSSEIGTIFGTWRGKDGISAAEPPAPALPAKTRVLLVDRPEAVQSAVIGILPAPKRAEPGYEARRLMATTLGGLFTSRLNANLREKNAFTYGAFSELLATRKFGVMVVSTSVRTDVTAPALDEIEAELRKIRDPSPATAIKRDEMQRAKAALVFGLGSTLEHPSRIADVTGDLFVHGLPLDYKARFAETLDGIQLEAIQATTPLVLPEQLLVVIVGDRAKMEPALKQRGYAVEVAPPALGE